MAYLKAYNPTKGAIPSGPSKMSRRRPARPTKQGGPVPTQYRSASDCVRAASRGGKNIIAVGTQQTPAVLAGAGPWNFTFDIAEDCTLARLNIQVTDPTGTVLDSSSQLVTQLNHNNDRLISGVQVNGSLFDLACQPGSNPVWGRRAIVSDQINISGISGFAAAHSVSVSISTM